MRRREFITLIGGTAAMWPLVARAQQGRLPRVGALVLAGTDARTLGDELREGLRELGYVEGQNFVFEVRSADGNADRLPELAVELVRLPVDVIVAAYTPCALAANRATTSIPIVMAAVADPVGIGLVQSLAQPGGNVTGLSNMAAETAGKSVELFRDMLPSLRRVAVLANPVGLGDARSSRCSAARRRGRSRRAQQAAMPVIGYVNGASMIIDSQSGKWALTATCINSRQWVTPRTASLWRRRHKLAPPP